MKTKRLFAVVATRPDFSETVLALHRNTADAAAANKRYADLDRKLAPHHKYIRHRVKPVVLDESHIAAIVEGWGKADALAGEKREEADRLPEPWRTKYLVGWFAAARKAD